MLARVVEAFETIHSTTTGGSFLVVTHGGVIRGLARSHGLADDPVANLAGITLMVTDSGATLGQRISLLEGQLVTVTQNDEL